MDIFDKELYRVKGETRGGMAQIYFVDHLRWGIPLAVKTPLPELVAEKSAMKRYIREAEVWVDLGMHPHIATCFYVKNVGKLPGIFIEYIDGGTLKDWIEGGRPLSEIIDLSIQFSRGMDYAHRMGVIHRDIKPANCLLTKEGILKITDFGIVRAVEAEEFIKFGDELLSRIQVEGSISIAGGKAGTPEYMAPEQFDTTKVGKEADIYSFGVMLYEVVCGRRPFVLEGINPQARLALYEIEHKNKIPQEPKKLRKDCPEALNSLIMKCLEKEPKDRYHSFKEIEKELIKIYEEVSGETYPREPVEELSLKADSLNNRGVSFYDLGKEEDAIKCWEEALKADPQHLEANFNLGYMRWEKAKISGNDLLIQMKNFEARHEGNPDYWTLLAWIHYEMGELHKIEKIQDKHGIQDKKLSKLVEGRFPLKVAHEIEGHTSWVTSVCFSPDGRYIASGSGDSIRLWNMETGEEVRRFEGHTHYVTSVCFSPDGRYIASAGGQDSTIRLWNIETGGEVRRFEEHILCVNSVVRRFERHILCVNSVCFSPDGRYIASGCDNTIRLWNVRTGREVRRFEGHTNYVTSVCFSPDGRYIASGSGDRTISLWDVRTGEEVRRFEGHTDKVTSVCFSPDGRYIASGSDDSTISLWDVRTGREVRRFEGHTHYVTSVYFSPDGRYIASGSEDRTIRLWDVRTGREVRRFEGHTDSVDSVCFSPDGRYIASAGGQDDTIRLWELDYTENDWKKSHPFPILSKPKRVEVFIEENKVVKSMLKCAENLIEEGIYNKAYEILRQAQSIPGFEREGKLLEILTVCMRKGKRKNLKDLWLNSILTGHIGYVTSVCFSPDGRYIASGSDDRTIRLWDIETGGEVRRFEGHTDKVTSVCFSPDGRYIASGSWDDTVSLLDIETGREVRRFKGHTDYSVESVCFSPDGRYIASGSEDRTIRLWDVRTGRKVRRFEGYTGSVTSVCFSPDGRYIASESRDRTIRLWDVRTGREVRRFKGHTGWVTSVCFSPDGQYIASGSDDRTIRLWDVRTGREVRRFEGHTDSVDSVCFSPDGRYIASGSDDRTIRLWDVRTGGEVRRFEGHIFSVDSVCFSPDGRYIASGSEDRTIRLWELDWEWAFPEPADWDEGARTYLEIFLTLHTPYTKGGIARKGKPVWTEEDFQRLLDDLSLKGYGWLRPDGVRRRLEEMSKET